VTITKLTTIPDNEQFKQVIVLSRLHDRSKHYRHYIAILKTRTTYTFILSVSLGIRYKDYVKSPHM
jgi:hypothetical protein